MQEALDGFVDTEPVEVSEGEERLGGDNDTQVPPQLVVAPRACLTEELGSSSFSNTASLLWREVGAVSGHQGALVVKVSFIGNPQPAYCTLHAPHRARPAAGESLQRLGGALPRPPDRRGGPSDEARTR